MDLPDINMKDIFALMGEKAIGCPHHAATRLPTAIRDYVEKLAQKYDLSYAAALRRLVMRGIKEQQYHERHGKGNVFEDAKTRCPHCGKNFPREGRSR